MDLKIFGEYSAVVYFALGISVVYFVWKYVYGESSSHSLPSFKKGGAVPFTLDLTEKAREGKFDKVIGRAEEIDRVIHILSRRTKNNPLLVGPAGVGKTAIAEGLAMKVASNDIPDYLKDKRVLALNVTELMSGTKYRGDFEARVNQLIQAIEGANRQVILFIDEIHMLVQTKGTEGALNVTDILKPALARGDLQIVGATSVKEYEQYIAPDETLERRFQMVTVDEPNVKDATEIVRGVKGNYEDFHDVDIEDDAVVAAVRLSHEYIKRRKLPDKAIDLIDEAGAAVKVRASQAPDSALALLHGASYQLRCEYDECPPELIELQKELKKMKKDEKKKLTKFQLETLHKRMIETVQRMETIEKSLTKKSGRPRVTVKEIKRIVADWAHIPLSDVH